ncbi:MAG TPA: hypothetical protein VHH90_09620 [Polyangia bacterium]|nr:hypothetical protein [Polyangia bacterium]
MRAREFKWLGLSMLLAAALAITGSLARGDDRNKCGCYKDGAGVCYCEKKAKCGCPGECEPKGCEEQRERALQKEIDAETKKAASSQKKPSAGPSGESSDERASADQPPAAPPAARPASHKLSAAQAKQLAKLIDLFLADHPDARGKSIDDVRSDLTP